MAPAKPLRKASTETINSKAGKPMLSVSRPAKGESLTIKVRPASGAGKDELITAIGKLL